MNEVLNRLAREKNSTNMGIATVFILRHPSSNRGDNELLFDKINLLAINPYPNDDER
ncbi:hypothetical protein [Dellaglioa carnosa]|uniref:hypothetical protein n=1 Tax=Dellaglioa carnosa TaxID=2995136 RepID=UPI0022A8814D|nr:hypothetical protein [Dellaglioa carnosa]MCZ2492855.1 hypothetical protein [Dellaglioa carnosa]